MLQLNDLRGGWSAHHLCHSDGPLLTAHDGTSPDTQRTYFVVYLEPLMLNLGNVSHLRAECAGRSSWRVRAGNKNVEEVKFL